MRNPLSAIMLIAGFPYTYTISFNTISSARLRILFMRRTHTIWSAALSASVTPSCFAIAFTRLSIRSLHSFSTSAKCSDRCKQVGIENWTMLFEITPAALSPYADVILRLFRHFKIRKQVVSLLAVCSAKLFKNSFLFHNRLLS